MPSFYTLTTLFGAALVRRDGRLVETHDAPPGQNAILLTAGALDTSPILGEAQATQQLGLLISTDAAPFVARLQPTGRPDTIRLRLDDDSGWSELRSAKTGAPDRPEIGAITDFLAARDRLGALTALADSDPALAGALAYFLTKPQALDAFETLRDHPAWPELFAGLQSAATNGVRRFEGDVRHRLAGLIDRFGWQIGRHSYGAPNVLDYGLGSSLSIGSYCSMNEFSIVLANHTSRTVTTFPFQTLANYWPTMRAHPEIDDHVAADVVIGNDVWIGRGVTILPGTTVGDGAILGANTVARGTIPPYAVVVGNPGKVVKLRFSEAEIARLLKIRWWDWPDWQVDRFAPLLSLPDLERFFAAVDAAGLSGDPPGAA